MKPDWSTAPEWAQFLAKDGDGIWYWHELKPRVDWGSFWEGGGKHRRASPETTNNWRESLEPRP